MIYVISDLHLGHDKILTFEKEDGSKLRNFNSIAEMNGTIIERWNSVVNENDKVYVLGDVMWGKDSLILMKAMKGRKILVKGNHDNHINVRKYLDVFDDVHGAKNLSLNGCKMMLTHIPIHPDSMGRWDLNIHGHMHSYKLEDSRYVNVSVEQVNYTPVSTEQIIEDWRERM